MTSSFSTVFTAPTVASAGVNVSAVAPDAGGGAGDAAGDNPVAEGVAFMPPPPVTRLAGALSAGHE